MRKHESSFLRKSLRSLDIYAKPIQLTYKGKEKFKTMFGGLISLIIVFSVTITLGYKLSIMLRRGQTTIKKNTLVSMSNDYQPPENLSNKNFSLAFMVSDYFATESLYDERFANIQLIQSGVKIDSNGNREFQTITIPISLCEIGKNYFQDPAYYEQYSLSTFFCPDL